MNTQCVMTDLNDIDKIYDYFNGEPAMLGYPRTEGNGISLSAYETLIANATDPNRETLYYEGYVTKPLTEELAPYFAGDVSMEVAVEKLDNRVQLYLDERAR